MKSSIVYIMLLCFLFNGCINFHPNKQQDEKSISEEAIQSDPEDDMLMVKSEHLKFKGVPIDGTLNKFVERMRRSGFKLEGIKDGTAVLTGDFADYKECTVYVETLDRKDLVARIGVIFPEQDRWEFLYGDYKHLKELLTEKYGKPSSCIEKFQGAYGLRPQDDDGRIHYIKENNCKYETRFAIDKGEIVLTIGHEGYSSCFVTLAYKDKTNGNIIREHAKDDL